MWLPGKRFAGLAKRPNGYVIKYGFGTENAFLVDGSRNGYARLAKRPNGCATRYGVGTGRFLANPASGLKIDSGISKRLRDRIAVQE